MTNLELIKNHTLFFAYFCHLIESSKADSAEELCEIGWILDEELNKRKITDTQIQKCIKNVNLDAQDQLMVSTYIYPELDKLNGKVGKS